MSDNIRYLTKPSEQKSLNSPIAVLIIPCYGYANFLPEQLSAIVAQKTEFEFVCVIVDDGDPDPAMVELCNLYASAYPTLFHYVRPRNNGGLSAARNSGINYALSTWSSLEVILIPDGDDRVEVDFVQRSIDEFRRHSALHAAKGTKLGWVFEHPRIFGMEGKMLRLETHSRLWNLVGATQMPSSALSAEMYREGLRYSEEFKWAGEDWEFSVAALELDYTAEYCSRQGFLWRRRPGSMSAAFAASLSTEHNRSLIRLRHKGLFGRDVVLKTYAEECAHYAFANNGMVRVTSSVQEPGTKKTIAAIAKQLFLNTRMPAETCPQMFVLLDANFPNGFLGSESGQLFGLLSSHFASRGICVRHRFEHMETNETDFALTSASYRKTDCASAFCISPNILTQLVLGKSLSSLPKAIEFEWSCPVDISTGEDVGQNSSDFINKLRESGYDFRPLRRHKTQMWRPRGLDWSALPAFLLNIPGIWLDPANLHRTLIIVPPDRIDEVMGRISEQEEPHSLLILGGHHARHRFNAIRANYPKVKLESVFYSEVLINMGVSRAAWRDQIFQSLIFGFGRVIHWATLEFTSMLAAMKSCGIERWLLLPNNEDPSNVLGENLSTFKAFDRYVVVKGVKNVRDDLSAFGVADELVYNLDTNDL